MTNRDDWVEIISAMPMAEARQTFEGWKQSHPGLHPLRDDDVRIDLIRTTEGDRIRYLVRSEIWQRLEGE